MLSDAHCRGLLGQAVPSQGVQFRLVRRGDRSAVAAT